MGQAGSVQQRSAVRDVLALRRPNVSTTELEEVLRTFCALFPLELQAPHPSLSSVVDVAVKERRLFDVIYGLLQEQAAHSPRETGRNMTELILTSFRRIIRWRELYKLCGKCSLTPLLTCVARPSPTLVLSVLETLEVILSPCPGVDVADRSETANRSNFGDAGGYDVLQALLVQYGASIGSNEPKQHTADVVQGVLKLFTLTVVSRRAMTDVMTCTQAVTALMNARVLLLSLCHHREAEYEIRMLAMGLVQELFCILDLDQVYQLQEAGREYGALLYALEAAVREESAETESGKEGEKERNFERDQREGCVRLVEFFCAGNPRSKKTMYRIVPVELFLPVANQATFPLQLATASSSSMVLTNEARSVKSVRHVSFDSDQSSQPSILMSNKRMETKRSSVSDGKFTKWLVDAREKGERWQEIVQAIRNTHESPTLVWRAPMRAELRLALQHEIQALESRQSREQPPRWDHEMFNVAYPSMDQEFAVNNYFIEYLIPHLADVARSCEIHEPTLLAWHLSDQLAIEQDEKRALLCVRCLRLILRRYAMFFHGQISIQYVLELLRDHVKHSVSFIRECFLLLKAVIISMENSSSKSLTHLCMTMTSTIVDILADPVFVATLSKHRKSNGEVDDTTSTGETEPEDKSVVVVNERDGLIRAGVSVLLAASRRAKFVLRLILPKRIFLCRLLAVETLDHVTITGLLALLKQLTEVHNSGHALPVSSHSSSVASHGSSTKDSNWESLTLVYVLLASCDPKGSGMCVATAEFLRESCAQSSKFCKGERSHDSHWIASCEFSTLLNDALGFGGCGMGRLLYSVSGEIFTSIFNASYLRAADVNWGQQQRVRLYRYLKFKYLGFSEKEAAGRSNHVDNDADPRYEDENLFIGNIFLRSYIEGDGEFLTKWTSAMYTELINALFEELVKLGHRKPLYVGSGSAGPSNNRWPQPSSRTGASCAAEPWEVQVLIVKALARLVPIHGAEMEIKPEFYDALIAPLRRSMLSEADQLRAILSLELFASILSVSETRSGNPVACRRFLKETGLRVLANSLERIRSPAYQQQLHAVEAFEPSRPHPERTQNMARVLLYRLTDLLTIVTKTATGIEILATNPDVMTALIELTSREMIMQYADVDAASVCLTCLGQLCHNDVLRAVVVHAGGMLTLLETIAFCPAEETLEEKERVPSRFFGAIRSAALVLRACVEPQDAPASSLPVQVLHQLVTPSLVRLLRSSPDHFIRALQSANDINTATLIWTRSMRHRLQACLTNELAKVQVAAGNQTWPRWNPDHFIAADSFQYQYPELADVLVFQDVYLANVVATPVDELDLGDLDMASFSEALWSSIQRHEHVLGILRERGSTDAAKEAAVQLMRQALDKLTTKHPPHHLEVIAGPRSMGGPMSPIPGASTDKCSPRKDRKSKRMQLERCSSSGIEDLTV
ncbi:hypothetical protein PsorP6_009275 [Peronosclerospora sorghi]|uniref:Uncharacterized protein n=1 Tax=Peronosclerospora sorghi TaxID=230839 RepID=A0ACC0W229_9STRA|nr:hypothetical protein PsorP6_009275 [Peronosclerospora sorghi]